MDCLDEVVGCRPNFKSNLEVILPDFSILTFVLDIDVITVSRLAFKKQFLMAVDGEFAARFFVS